MFPRWFGDLYIITQHKKGFHLSTEVLIRRARQPSTSGVRKGSHVVDCHAYATIYKDLLVHFQTCQSLEYGGKHWNVLHGSQVQEPGCVLLAEKKSPHILPHAFLPRGVPVTILNDIPIHVTNSLLNTWFPLRGHFYRTGDFRQHRTLACISAHSDHTPISKTTHM